jgi:hypothetical protein
MKTIVLLLLACMAFEGSSHAKETMIHIVFKCNGTSDGEELQTSGEIWRVGSKRLKLITEMGISFAKDADAWHISKTGKAIHSYDSGPSQDIRVTLFQTLYDNPISQTQPPYARIKELEFGNEIRFFETNKSRKFEKENEILDILLLDKYVLTLSSDQNSRPIDVIITGPNCYLQYIYDTYEVLDVPEDSFFDPPMNIQFEEVEN